MKFFLAFTLGVLFATLLYFFRDYANVLQKFFVSVAASLGQFFTGLAGRIAGA